MSLRSPGPRRDVARTAGSALAVACTLAAAACAPTTPTTSPSTSDGAMATESRTATQASAVLAPTTASTAATTTASTTPAPRGLPTGAAPPTFTDLGITSATSATFDAVATLDVRSPFRDPLWVAYTTGLRSYDPDTPHTVAVLSRDASTWRVVDRVDLGGEAAKADAAATPDVDAYYGPDYLGEGSVAQVQIEPSRLWLTVDGGIGAHGGSFAVLSFDGRHLKLEAHASNGFPGVGRVEDLDGDGVGEVVIDQTDAYVFCYACGVREASVGVLKWDGDRLRSIVLEPVAGADNVRCTLDAVAGGFWQTAANLARFAVQSQGSTPPSPSSAVPRTHQDLLNLQGILENNSTVIHANFVARAARIGSDDPYPVLHHVFLGDWPGAVEPLRSHTPERLFAPDSPLVVGTPADGNVPALAERIGIAAGSALTYGPKLADAPTDFQWDPASVHFLRGWSAWLVTPGDAAARADIAEAAELAPEDPLYTSSATWIATQP